MQFWPHPASPASFAAMALLPQYTAPHSPYDAGTSPQFGAHYSPYGGVHPYTVPQQLQPWTRMQGGSTSSTVHSFNTMSLNATPSTEWYADSGAGAHTVNNAGILSSFHPPSRYLCWVILFFHDGSSSFSF